jgi:hypothetical protein
VSFLVRELLGQWFKVFAGAVLGLARPWRPAAVTDS